MPNWVDNYMFVVGDQSELDKFRKHASAPNGDRDDSPLHFGNFIPEPPESDGYNWCIDNWDTKWDACYADLDDSQDEVLRYNFQTAWSVPMAVFNAMTEQFPNLTFDIRSIEEQGWGMEIVGRNGQLSITEQWDIPSCHQDWVEMGNEEGCVCSWSDDPEDMWSDCPNYVAKPIEQQVMEKIKSNMQNGISMVEISWDKGKMLVK
jgi:hypothetical protein